MTAKYWQKGEVLDYKASAAVKNGEVVTSMWWVSLRWKRTPVP